MELVTLTKSPGWYGQRSGYYGQLPKYLTDLGIAQRVISPGGCLWERLLGKLVALAWRTPPRNQSVTWAEYRFARVWQNGQDRLGFLTSFESHLPFIVRWPKAPRNLVATIHFPLAQLNEEARKALRSFSSAIVLYTRDLPFFEEHVGKGRVKFVAHGVDCEFFSPSDDGPSGSPKSNILVVGQFDRDFPLIRRLAAALGEKRPEVEVRLVVAPHGTQVPGVPELMGLPNVHTYVGVPDEELRDLYRQAAVLLLPLRSSGANNAIVEALASGLPVVTNDVGGIRDYGGGTVFPLGSTEDELRDLLFRYLDDGNWRRDTGKRCRAFALEHLAWPKVAAQHWSAMQDLACG